VGLLTLLLQHVCFFYFSDTCSLGSNGSTKFLESPLSLILFQRANLALVLECYACVSLLKIYSPIDHVIAKLFSHEAYEATTVIG
jgi:hypothetical protein